MLEPILFVSCCNNKTFITGQCLRFENLYKNIQ